MEEDQLDSVAAGGEIEFEGIEGVFRAAGGWGGEGAEGGGGCLRKQQTKCSDLSAVMAHNNREGQLQRTIVKK